MGIVVADGVHRLSNIVTVTILVAGLMNAYCSAEAAQALTWEMLLPWFNSHPECASDKLFHRPIPYEGEITGVQLKESDYARTIVARALDEEVIYFDECESWLSVLLLNCDKHNQYLVLQAIARTRLAHDELASFFAQLGELHPGSSLSERNFKKIITTYLEALYRRHREQEIIDSYPLFSWLWHAHPGLLNRRLTGKAHFRRGLYPQALKEFEIWYDESTITKDTVTFYDPRFYILRTLIYLHPHVAVSQLFTLLCVLLIPLVATALVYRELHQVKDSIRAIIILCAAIAAVQIWAHLSLNTLSGTTIFYVTAAGLRNAILLLAGSILVKKISSPQYQRTKEAQTRFGESGAWHTSRYWIELLGWLLLMVCITGVLASIFHPHASTLPQQINRYIEVSQLTTLQQQGDRTLLFFFLTVTAVVEELYCRVFGIPLLIWLMGKKRWATPVAILVISFIWSFAHSGVVEPELYKIMQVFSMGTILGISCVRQGFTSAVLLHMVFNGGLFFFVS